MVEVLIAMFTLATMSLALVPLLIGSVRASQVNGALVAATSYANAQLAAIRDDFANDAENSCAAVAAKAHTGTADPTGSGLLSDLTVSACPSSYPGTVKAAVSVYRSVTPSTVLVTLRTEVLVTQA